MNVTFLSDSPLNSTVVDLKGGGHLYDISTEFDFKSSTMRCRTTMHNLDGDVVGLWERSHQRDKDRITYHDKMHMLADWLPKKSVLSRCVHFCPVRGVSFPFEADHYHRPGYSLCLDLLSCIFSEVRTSFSQSFNVLANPTC